MTEPTRIKCAIPQSWQVELELLAQQQGQSVEQIVYEAIARYLGKHAGKEYPGQAHLGTFDLGASEAAMTGLTQMQNQLNLLESRLVKADMALMQTAALAARLTAIEQTLGQAHPISSPDAPANLDAEEEIEDEPDEILVGFLESDDFQERLQQAIDPTAFPASAPFDADAGYEDDTGEILYDFIEP